MIPVLPGVPTFAITPTRIAFGTVLTGLIPPYPGSSGGDTLANIVNGQPNWYQFPYTHLSKLLYTCSTTAHTVTVLRPLNWALFTVAVAKNTTAITIDKDPGAYTTSYRYPLPGAQAAPTLAANNTLASGDFVAYQMDDGVWQMDTIASGTFGGANIVLTTGTPNNVGATIRAGSPLFWFGAVGDTNPATGLPHTNFLVTASTNKIDQIGGSNGECIPTLNGGDPMIVHSNNATATGVIDLAAGYYGKF